MEGQAIILKPGETLETATRVHLDAPPDLAFLKEGVGGYIEAVPKFEALDLDGDRKRCVAFCNEEGKIHRLQPNFEAQRLWEASFGHLISSDFLVGPIVILTGDEEFLEAL